jgi:hypothetical protein
VNHPYRYPDQVPGSEEYRDLQLARKMHSWSFIDADDHSRYFSDENVEEFEDALFGVI